MEQPSKRNQSSGEAVVRRMDRKKQKDEKNQTTTAGGQVGWEPSVKYV